MTTEQIKLPDNEKGEEVGKSGISGLRENFKCTIGVIVDKSNATTGCNQVLAPIPYIGDQKRPEEIRQIILYKAINQVRHFLGLATILPPAPYHR